MHRVGSRAVGVVATAAAKVQRKNTFASALADCLDNIDSCVKEAGMAGEVDAVVVGNMLAPQLQRQQQFASYLASQAGLSDAAQFTVDAACGSGGAALQLGYNLVLGGGFRNVLVVGFEYMTHDNKSLITQALAGASNWETEGGCGATFVSLNGQVLTAYTKKYGVQPDELRHISINGHTNANTTAHALFHGKGGLTEEQFRASQLINPNLVLYAASSICNGSAAVMLSSSVKSHHPRIVASASAGDNIDTSKRGDLTDVRWKNKLASSSSCAALLCARECTTPRDCGRVLLSHVIATPCHLQPCASQPQHPLVTHL
jgi:acetyl-CoA acetyltransferase